MGSVGYALSSAGTRLGTALRPECCRLCRAYPYAFTDACPQHDRIPVPVPALVAVRLSLVDAERGGERQPVRSDDRARRREDHLATRIGDLARERLAVGAAHHARPLVGAPLPARPGPPAPEAWPPSALRDRGGRLPRRGSSRLQPVGGLVRDAPAAARAPAHQRPEQCLPVHPVDRSRPRGALREREPPAGWAARRGPPAHLEGTDPAALPVQHSEHDRTDGRGRTRRTPSA